VSMSLVIVCLKDSEMTILHELSRLQEVIDVMSEQTKDSTSLPQCGEQVLLDLKSADTTCIYQVCCNYICIFSVHLLFRQVLLACTLCL